MKDDGVYLENILECIRRISEYTLEGREAFMQSTVIQDAVIRNFEVIGEVTKQLSQQIRDENTEIPWRRMAGFRDVLIHNYMSLKLNLIWNTVQTELPLLKPQVETLLQSLDSDS